jgi:acyl-CoA reductase-like NAD-dependent aldehyde dehydrogenase
MSPATVDWTPDHDSVILEEGDAPPRTDAASVEILTGVLVMLVIDADVPIWGMIGPVNFPLSATNETCVPALLRYSVR